MTEVLNLFVLSTVALFSVSLMLSIVFSFLSCNAKYGQEAKKLLYPVLISSFLAVLSPFAICLFSDIDLFYTALEMASTLYTIFAGAWMIILVLNVLIFLFTLVMKKEKTDTQKERKKYLYSQAAAFVCSLLFAWMFS